MNKLGQMFYYLRVIRVYKNGDGFGFVWRWWNPVAWIFAPLLFLISAVLEGVPYTWAERYTLGFKLDPYFVDHPEQLEWL